MSTLIRSHYRWLWLLGFELGPQEDQSVFLTAEHLSRLIVESLTLTGRAFPKEEYENKYIIIKKLYT